MHQKTAWDAAIDRGVVKGKLELLLSLGRERLGKPDDRVESELKAIQDPDRLERLGLAILKARSWKALLSVQ